MPKRGRLSNKEKEFIHSRSPGLTPQAIADELDRTLETVEEFVRLNVVEKPRVPSPEALDERKAIRQELRTSERWKRLKQELTDEEIRFFEEEFVKLMAQFKNDVLATEEGQVFDMIRLDLLKSRNMVARRRAREDIARMERAVDDMLGGHRGDPVAMPEDDKRLVADLDNQLLAARQAEQASTNEYVKLQERLDRLKQSLKATRDQRIKEISDSKVSFLGYLKLLGDADVRQREGKYAELTRLAGQKEYERLGAPMKFDNGDEDCPILSADTGGARAEATEE